MLFSRLKPAAAFARDPRWEKGLCSIPEAGLWPALPPAHGGHAETASLIWARNKPRDGFDTQR